MARALNIAYQVLQPSNYDAAVKLMLQNYLRYERACQLLNVNYFPSHDKYAEEYFYDMATKNCSFEAVDQEKDLLVATQLNTEIFKNAPESNYAPRTGDWAKLLAVYSQNRSVIPDVFKHFNTDKYFYLGYLAVRPDYGSYGVGVNLLRKCVDHGQFLGHKVAVADVTAEQTKHICINKMGFEILGEMKYKDFVWNGEQVLKEVNETENLKFVAKVY